MKGSNVKQLSDNQRKITAMPTIESQLPLSVPGGVRLSEFEGVCPFCETKIPDQDLHGSFKEDFRAVIILEALGACPRCKIWIPFNVRFRRDGTMEWRKDGVWVQTQLDIRKKILARIRRLTGGAIAFYILFLPLIAAFFLMVSHIKH